MPATATIQTIALSIFGFVASALITGFISANVRRWATEKGHDAYLLKAWNMLPEWGHSLLAGWGPLRQLWWAWLILGLSGGLGLSLLISSRPPLPASDIPVKAGPESPLQPDEAKPERSPPVYGSLQSWQSTLFINALAGMKEELASKIIIARPHMVEPQQFSRVFENAAFRAGVKPIVVEQNSTGPDQTGVMIAVPDTNSPSSSALKMRGIIQQLGSEGRIVPLLSTPESSPAKEIGNFAIFIGPSPL
jgi:hypothetical protein